MKKNTFQICFGVFAIIWGLIVSTGFGGWLTPLGIACGAAGCFCLWSALRYRQIRKGENNGKLRNG